MMHTMIYNFGDIVIIPFPFFDNKNYKPRPAVVLSNFEFNKSHMNSLLSMITTASNTKWDSDIEITNYQEAGLKTKSIIRFKIFTLDNRLIKSKIGTLHNIDKNFLSKSLTNIFAN